MAYVTSKTISNCYFNTGILNNRQNIWHNMNEYCLKELNLNESKTKFDIDKKKNIDNNVMIQKY